MDELPERRAAYFREIAERLRRIAGELRFEPRRQEQLLALADGFERHARRFEESTSDDSRE